MESALGFEKGTRGFDMIRKMSESLVNVSTDNKIAIFKFSNWISIPLETSSHLSKKIQSDIVVSVNGIGEMYGYAIENIEGLPFYPAISAPANLIGIDEINRRTSHFSCNIFHSSLRFSMLCTAENFIVVTGEAKEINEIFSTNIEDSLKLFEKNMIDNGDWTYEENSVHKKVLKSILRYNEHKIEEFVELY